MKCLDNKIHKCSRLNLAIEIKFLNGKTSITFPNAKKATHLVMNPNFGRNLLKIEF